MTGFFDFASDELRDSRNNLATLLRNSPIPDNELLHNLLLYSSPALISRFLSLERIYKIALESHGDILEMGTRWGQNIAIFNSLRSIYEPYNRFRRIIAFDTFEGFPEIDPIDGSKFKAGSFSTTADYYAYLNKVISYLDKENVKPCQNLIEVIKGDAVENVKKYIIDNPSTIVSLAFFDFDIYKPTKKCLQYIIPRLVKGSVVAFDEANDKDCPGETQAIIEEIGLNNISLKRSHINSRISYFVF